MMACNGQGWGELVMVLVYMEVESRIMQQTVKVVVKDFTAERTEEDISKDFSEVRYAGSARPNISKRHANVREMDSRRYITRSDLPGEVEIYAGSQYRVYLARY